MKSLIDQRCRRYEKTEQALASAELTDYAKQTPKWGIADGWLSRKVTFKNYYETIAFVNAMAYLVHEQDHHPDLEVGYNRCVVKFRTHSVDGLTANDFICAARIDLLIN